MTKKEKLLRSLKNAKTMKWSSIETVFKQLGYVQQEMKGSRVRFYHPDTKVVVRLHNPHPENEVKGGALNAIKQHLTAEGYL